MGSILTHFKGFTAQVNNRSQPCPCRTHLPETYPIRTFHFHLYVNTVFTLLSSVKHPGCFTQVASSQLSIPPGPSLFLCLWETVITNVVLAREEDSRSSNGIEILCRNLNPGLFSCFHVKGKRDGGLRNRGGTLKGGHFLSRGLLTS